MEKREQFEILSRELLGRLNDVTTESKLFFPFGYTISPELEEKYFKSGTKLRSITISNMIIIDNSFKKFLLFPSHDILVTYIETQKDLLFQWELEVVQEFKEYYDKCEEARLEAENVAMQEVVANGSAENSAQPSKAEEEKRKKAYEERKEKDTAEFKKVVEKMIQEINEASKPLIRTASSSEEARELDGENGQNQGMFAEFIHNTISSLFK